jgi:hypothetical protein
MMTRAAALLFAAVVFLAGCNTTGSSTVESEDPGGESTASPQAAAEEASESEPASASGLDQEALDAVTRAAANTTEEGTARFELFIETADTGGEDGRQPITVEGEEDFEASQRNLTFKGPEGDLAVVVDDTDVYVEVPGTEDEDWARIELEALTDEGVGFGGPAGLPFQSAQDNFAVLNDAITAAAGAGEEEVRGEPATRYDLVVDLEQAAQQAADDDASTTFETIVEKSGVTELDMQVWVDEEERISRVSYTLDLSQTDVDEVSSELASEFASEDVGDVEAEASGRVTVTVEYFDYGTELNIEIPAEDAVVDIDEEEIQNSFSP